MIEPSMAAVSTPRTTTRERRKRESISPLALTAAPLESAAPAAPAPVLEVATAPAFHEVEEAFFRAGADPALPRNEGDEYEPDEPGLLGRIFKK